MEVIHHPHPVTPIAGRRAIAPTFKGDTIREVLIRAGVDTHQPIVVTLNDRMLLVEEWDTVCPQNGDLINVQATVMGGGGGGGSNPLQVVAMLALVVVIVALQQYELLPAMGTWQGALAAGAIMMAGSYVINSIFAAQVPGLEGLNNPGSEAQSSPTYSLTGGSNRTRPYEPMPVIMGTHRFFPDNGARPFTEYKDNDQYLYQVFNMGLSDAAFTDWRIGNTLVTAYADYIWYPANADGKIVSFPGNVDSAQGGELTHAAGWITRTTSDDVYQIGIDIEALLYYANSSGGLDARSVSFEIQYAPKGSGAWVSAGVKTLTGASQTQIRHTYYIPVSKGAYDVRISRSTPDSTDAREQTKTNWSTIRSYQEDPALYRGQTRLGIMIRASQQLNGTIQQMSALASAKANYFDGTTWVKAPTSNPAHWFMDFALGRKNSDGALVYGVNLTPAQMDIQALSAWAAFCNTEGLTFNGVIDSSMTSSEVLTAIARCGFGSPSWASGKLGVVWDGRNQAPVAAFGMSNIVKGSFEVRYITEQLAEEIIVTYRNPDDDWAQSTVRVLVKGVSGVPARTSQIDLFGCTSKTMAGKFANYMAAQQYYRKRRITWDTDPEGFVCQRGDVVLLSHDLTQWGYSGRLIEASGKVVKLDRPVPRSGTVEYFMCKRPDGTMTTYQVEPADGEGDVLTLTSDIVLQADYLPLDHVWMFAPTATPGKRVKIVEIAPSSDSKLKITATDEDPEFYAAWDGKWIDPVRPNLLRDTQVPVIANLSFRERLGVVGAGIFVTRVTFNWDLRSSQCERVDFRFRLNGGAWRYASALTGTSLDVDFDGDGMVEAYATPVNGSYTGRAISYTGIIYGKRLPPQDVVDFNGVLDPSIGLTLTWTSNQDVDLDYYEIREGVSWDVSITQGRTKATSWVVPMLPTGEHNYWIKAVDTSGNYSLTAANYKFVTVAPGVPVVSVVSYGVVFNIDMAVTQGSLAIWDYEIRQGDSWETGALVGHYATNVARVPCTWVGTRRFWCKATDVAGNASSSAGGTEITVTLPKAPVVTADVVDNNVMLHWTIEWGTLVSLRTEILKGPTLETATVVGYSQYGFSVLFETKGGEYTYWVRGQDANGNLGAATSIVVKVGDPPNFDVKLDYDSLFDGAKVNAVAEQGSLYIPVDTAETFEQHFVSRGWNTPQDQIDAGYPVYADPAGLAGSYDEEHDYGWVIPSGKIQITPTTATCDGLDDATALRCVISYREKATDPWVDTPDVWEVAGKNFRYIKVRIEANTEVPRHLVQLTKLHFRVYVKTVGDSGVAACKATDEKGTWVPFNHAFAKVLGITLTPKGTEPRYAVYDFDDVPNPKGFSIYLFDMSGKRVDGDCSWIARGV